VIFYGGTGWINKVYERYPGLPGIFFNPENTPSHCAKVYGEKSLNHDARLTTFKKLAEEDHNDDERFFIRPDSDLKEFSGGVMKFGDIKNWCNKIFTDVPDLGDLSILIGEPYGLSYEWRLFMINGKYCTGSQYRTYYVLNKSPVVPDEVIKFAEEQAEVYSPSEVFVMDIGKSGGDLYIIETGCFNSAGFYDSDINKIVKEVSEFLVGKYYEQKPMDIC